MMPGVPQRMTTDYVRAGTTTLFATLDLASGKVIASLHRHHRADEFTKFLMTLDKQTPPGLDLHLALDNYATHKTPAIKAWLLAHPRFHLHFTPIGSSWLNLVERWFAELTNKQIRRGVHKSIQALEKDIRSWIAQWNTDPKPYVWTKTADEILERLASYLNRIPDSEHQAQPRHRVERRVSSIRLRGSHAYVPRIGFFDRGRSRRLCIAPAQLTTKHLTLQRYSITNSQRNPFRRQGPFQSTDCWPSRRSRRRSNSQWVRCHFKMAAPRHTTASRMPARNVRTDARSPSTCPTTHPRAAKRSTVAPMAS